MRTFPVEVSTCPSCKGTGILIKGYRPTGEVKVISPTEHIHKIEVLTEKCYMCAGEGILQMLIIRPEEK